MSTDCSIVRQGTECLFKGDSKFGICCVGLVVIFMCGLIFTSSSILENEKVISAILKSGIIPSASAAADVMRNMMYISNASVSTSNGSSISGVELLHHRSIRHRNLCEDDDENSSSSSSLYENGTVSTVTGTEGGGGGGVYNTSFLSYLLY